LAIRLGASSTAAAISACWLAACQPLLLFSFEANVDTIFVAGYLVSTYFGIKHVLDDRRARTDMILAGIAAGLAWGTKPTATLFIPPLLAVFLISTIRSRQSVRAKLESSASLVGSTLIAGGFWFARSAILFGNPLYPLQLSIIGKWVLPGWYSSAAMIHSQFYIPRSHWLAGVDILNTVLDPRLVPLWALAICGLWQFPKRVSGPDRWVWMCSILACANVGLYWWFIPYRTQQRFMLHAVGLACIPLARLLTRSIVWRVAATLLLLVNVLTPHSWPIDPSARSNPWSLSGEVPTAVQADIIGIPLTSGTLREVVADPVRLASMVLVLSVGLGALVISWLWARALARPGPARVVPAVLASAGLFVGLGLVIHAQTPPVRRALPGFRDYIPAWLALRSITPKQPPGLRIAYAGTNLPYYLMGDSLQNDVSYVNIDSHRDWILHDYHRTAGDRGEPSIWATPRPGWDRIRPNFDAWLENLRAARVQILVVARANRDDGLFNLADAESFPIERVWADSHPELFTPIYGVAENDREMKIYRVRDRP
jgi:hypothetical protein